MIKKLIILLILPALLSCGGEKNSIQFKKMVNFELGNLERNSATLHGTAVFMNLTDQAYKMKDLVLDFTIDGDDIGTVVIKMNKIIEPKSEFSVPISYT